MTTFWILAGLMTAVALAFIVPPFLRRLPATGVSREELNLALYRERLAELQRALDAGTLDAATFARDREELDRELLADLPAAPDAGNARRGRWGAVLAAAAVVGVALALYQHLGLLPLPPGDA
ncbi:MAG: c-type cytochrome biogenesis protein CcmI, partial [Pseudomonadota bacterium]|nr:c-type cytochrome biogenesis protein CcmI [Pseudomonadota bacterium]